MEVSEMTTNDKWAMLARVKKALQREVSDKNDNADNERCYKVGCKCDRPTIVEREVIRTDVRCPVRGCGHWNTVKPGVSHWCKQCGNRLPHRDYAAWAWSGLAYDEHMEVVQVTDTEPAEEEFMLLFDDGEAGLLELGLEAKDEEDTKVIVSNGS